MVDVKKARSSSGRRKTRTEIPEIWANHLQSKNHKFSKGIVERGRPTSLSSKSTCAKTGLGVIPTMSLVHVAGELKGASSVEESGISVIVAEVANRAQRRSATGRITSCLGQQLMEGPGRAYRYIML